MVKAWHKHELQTDYFCVVNGNARVVLYYEDEDKFETYFIGEHNPKVIKIVPDVWHGYTAIGNKPCGLLYFVNNKYDPNNPDEIRADWNAFNYEWKPENK